MCLIVDANLAAQVFADAADRSDSRFAPLVKWLYSDQGKLVIGGKLTRELYKVAAARRALVALNRAGKAWIPPKDGAIEEEMASLPPHRSDDPHVLALARLSGARTLCTEDGDLESDFKNRAIVPAPKGVIYKNETHRRLLKHTRGCQGPSR